MLRPLRHLLERRGGVAGRGRAAREDENPDARDSVREMFCLVKRFDLRAEGGSGRGAQLAGVRCVTVTQINFGGAKPSSDDGAPVESGLRIL